MSFGFRPGFLSGGHFDVVSYNANFTATSGNLSSQFGLHYLNFRPDDQASVMHGLGTTAVALFSNPLDPHGEGGGRYAGGVPRAAVAVYVGAAPAVLISGESIASTIPLVLGLGVPWSPSETVTITPWIEGSPALNLDTVIHTGTVDLAGTGTMVTGTPQNPKVTLSNDAIHRILDQTVEFDTRVTFGARAGLDLTFRLGDSADFDVSGTVGSIGSAFSGALVAWLGGSLMFRWDKVVPAVLSPERRLQSEDCNAIEDRYRACQTIRNYTPGPASGYGRPQETYPTYPSNPPYTMPPTYPTRQTPPTYPTPGAQPVPQGYPQYAPAPDRGRALPPPQQPPPAPGPSGSGVPTGAFPP